MMQGNGKKNRNKIKMFFMLIMASLCMQGEKMLA